MFRFSQSKLVEMLQRKVARLAEPTIFARSQILCRGLAKDGLMQIDINPVVQENSTQSADNSTQPEESMVVDQPEVTPKGVVISQNLQQGNVTNALSSEKLTQLLQLEGRKLVSIYYPTTSPPNSQQN